LNVQCQMPIESILLSINVRWWNAEAAYAINLARALINDKKKVQVIVNRNSPAHQKAIQYNIPVITDISLDSVSPMMQLKNLRKVLSLIDRENIQVINSFKSNGSFIFSIAKKLRPHICYFKTRGEARPPRKNWINNYLYGPKACDGLIAVGRQVKKWLTQLSLEGQKIRIIHYGDSAALSELPVDKDQIKQKFNLPLDSKILALIGRNQRVKGHMILLEAFKKLRHPSSHLVFLIKDLNEFPEELAEIKMYIKNNYLDAKVTILGFQEDIGSLMSCIDVGVIPSLSSEVNCRVAVEFFSGSIPVVAFPTGTLPDIIHHQINGCLCEQKTATDLVEKLDWLLEDESRRIENGLAAFRSYQEEYTLEKFAKKTEEFYNLSN